MSVWLKITLIVAGAMVVSIGLGFIPRDASSLPPLHASPPPFPKSVQQENQLLQDVLSRPPQAAVSACTISANPSNVELTHSELVRIATCLNRRHLVSAQTVAAVEASKLGQPTKAVLVGGLQTKIETGVWWWASFVTWLVALAMIAVVVYRHVRRRPPPGGQLPASS